MDQSNNIVAAFNALWNLDTDITGAVTGGLQWSKDHMKAQADRPYAQVWVSMDGPPLWTTGLSYVQRYLIECSVWCGDDNTVMVSVDGFLDDFLPITTKLETTGFLTDSANTIDIVMVPFGLDQEETRSTLENVGVIRRAWRASLNETREAL
jgi:hypothetical protein